MDGGSVTKEERVVSTKLGGEAVISKMRLWLL